MPIRDVCSYKIYTYISDIHASRYTLSALHCLVIAKSLKYKLPFDAHCCHDMGAAAIKHPVPDRIKPSFVIFDIRAL